LFPISLAQFLGRRSQVINKGWQTDLNGSWKRKKMKRR
jgi:hypothetical protein